MRTVRAFVQENRETLAYSNAITDVLKLSYKEALARSIFWSMVCYPEDCWCNVTKLLYACRQGFLVM
jgi:hypothetical protein